jgi:hypothetical protein
MTEQVQDEWPPRKARTLEDWDAYWERQRWDRRFMRQVVRPRWFALKRRLAAPRRWVREARWFIHRGQHGWARPDWWSLDGYICQLIGEALTDLRDKGHAYPGDGVKGGETPEEWAATLTRIIDPLLAYKTHWDWPDGLDVKDEAIRAQGIIEDAQAALHLMADWLPALWD